LSYEDVNDEIEFGEVEEAAPQRALRPDENRHYAVAAYGEPQEADLTIFVDLDVLADMEDHAHSNTSVELGGVLLGGCHHDERGQPFFVITDSLRAAHYESTKGSFKFTHDTWSEITRQRDQFPAEIQMVGWYHTHPDWGVFLSGMDMFICDNFFNKKLDIAYVIDPCRGDRAMFQWTGDPRQRVRRTGGFFVTASRFRAAELEYYVAELTASMPATTSFRAQTGSSPAPVVHLHQPREPQPPWQPLAIGGALALQFLLVALIAWKTLVPPAAAEKGGDVAIAKALENLDASLKSIEARRRLELAEERTRARTQFLDEAFRELKGADTGAISRLADRFDKTAEREADVAARDAQIRELAAFAKSAGQKITELEDSAKNEQRRLKARNEELEERYEQSRADLAKKKDEVASLQAKLNIKTDDEKTASDSGPSSMSKWWWIGGGILAAIALVAGVWWIGRSEAPPATSNEAATKPGFENANKQAEGTEGRKETKAGAV
jgi:proteasome lid subunit RPN8/RPN11